MYSTALTQGVTMQPNKLLPARTPFSECWYCKGSQANVMSIRLMLTKQLSTKGSEGEEGWGAVINVCKQVCI